MAQLAKRFMTTENGSIALSTYASGTASTDILDASDLRPVLLGLYGEVGGIMATAKKHKREGVRFPGYERNAREEFGDALWYLTALCRRLAIDLESLFAEASSGDGYRMVGIASDVVGGACASVAMPVSTADLDARLFKLGRSAAALLSDSPNRKGLLAFARDYLEALHGTGLVFSDVVRGNLFKVQSAFLEPDPTQLIDFDATFGAEEQIPRKFVVRISQRPSGKSYLQWNGVFIGDPLTDNIGDPDGYRFHDVFHLANAAILHWSPVIRALIKHKRKSNPTYDESEDGGRAIVVEEGVTAWIFTQAKEVALFEGQNRVSLGLLKSIGEFVKGFEVDRCPLKLWERSILQGYEVFRQVREARSGWVVGDRDTRTISYRPPEWSPT